MDIIDSHHHLWDTGHLQYTLFDTIPMLNRSFTQVDFDALAARHHVRRSVCVEAASAGADGLAEVRWLLDQARRSSVVERLVVWAPLDQPHLRTYLDQVAGLDDGCITGVRRSFEFEAPDFPSSNEVVAGINMLAEYGYTCDLVFYHRSLPAVVELVKACPGVQFILDHLGKPPIREARFDPWARQLAELAACPNIVCKVSGLTTEAEHQRWTRTELKPYIDHALQCYGWDRVMFGSDWPVCNLAGGFERWLDAILWAIADATEDNKRRFFSENARRIYRLDAF